MSLIDEIVEKVQVLSEDKNYWFVRSASGRFFETFVNESFIGIGWNEISYEDLTTKKPTEVKEKISKLYKIDTSIRKGKSKVTNIYNKLKSFIGLKKGDLIIVPSVSSSRLAFGEIIEDFIYIENDKLEECTYRKRRKIKWITVKNINNLNPIFYQIKKSRHSISSVNKYQSHIDAVTNELFFKDDKTHLVFDIKKQDNINVTSLVGFLDEIHSLSQSINLNLNLKEDIDGASVKLNLQSPGKIEFIYPKGKSLVLALTLISIFSCSDPDNHPQNTGDIKALYETNKVKLDSIDKKLLSLEAERFKNIK